jgi:endonuclease-3
MLTKRKQALLDQLRMLYPEPKSELNFNNEYQLLVSVVLSAQCTDKKVNDTTPALFKKYPNFKQLAKADVAEVEGIIRQINYYKTKSKNIVSTAQIITANFGGAVPRSMEELTSLPGVGRKTANVVLGELGIEPSIAVDTHVFRVSRRLGVAKGANPSEVEQSLRKGFPPSSWRDLHHQLIFHGRRVCKARNPLCGECLLANSCPSKGTE